MCIRDRISEQSAVEPALDAPFFAALGRLQSRLTQDTPDEAYSWMGTVTDFLVDGNGTVYALLSDRVSDVKPRLIRYEPQVDRMRVLYQASTHFEYWRLASADFDTFYILKTTGTREAGLPVLASYNPSESNTAAPPQTSVTKYVASTRARTEILNTGVAQRPQLSTFHFYGQQRERLGFVPDTRQNFAVARGVLWYRYASRSSFGLGRYRESDGALAMEISIRRDGRNNEASFDFFLDETGNKIYGSHTTQTTTRSRILVYEKPLAASY